MTAVLKGIDCAAATDGGSLLLLLEWSDGQLETIKLNRSIASHGTTAYNVVTSNKRLLSAVECFAIANELELPPVRIPTGCRPMLAEFITALKMQGASVV
jgi:hypothetical protein